MQRCLIKHLEDLKVNYDMTVRDADGSVVQWRSGEDGVDVTKSAQLFNFKFLADNYPALLDRLCASRLVDAFPGKHGKLAIKMQDKAVKSPDKHDTVLAKLRPDTYFGCVSEKLYKAMLEYVSTHKETDLAQRFLESQLSPSKFKSLVYLKYHHALVDPGEAVGILAAMAVGEPSTQVCACARACACGCRTWARSLFPPCSLVSGSGRGGVSGRENWRTGELIGPCVLFWFM